MLASTAAQVRWADGVGGGPDRDGVHSTLPPPALELAVASTAASSDAGVDALDVLEETTEMKLSDLCTKKGSHSPSASLLFGIQANFDLFGFVIRSLHKLQINWLIEMMTYFSIPHIPIVIGDAASEWPCGHDFTDSA